jgi:hypothetical protein
MREKREKLRVKEMKSEAGEKGNGGKAGEMEGRNRGREGKGWMQMLEEGSEGKGREGHAVNVRS